MLYHHDVDQKPEEKIPAPAGTSAFRFKMWMATSLVNEVDRAAAKRGQSRAAWLRDAAVEKLGRNQAPESRPVAATSDFPFMMYMPQWLGDKVTQAAKEQGISRSDWLRLAATEKLERDGKEDQ